MDYEALYLLFRQSHIAVGFLGLIAFWISIVAKKGDTLHIRAGRCFEWSGYYVAGTALFACVRYLLTPQHFAFIDRPEASAAELSRIEFAQFFLTLLAFLAWLFLNSLRTGMRAVRTRHRSAEEYRNWEAKWWLYSQLVAGIALVCYGVYRLTQGGHSVHWISLIVGSIPLLEFRKDRDFYLQPRKEKMSWWYKHMDCMLGCGVAFHTAGFVFTSRWASSNLGYELQGWLQLVPWIVPTAVGVPLSQKWLAHYRQKFGDLPTSKSAKNEIKHVAG